MPNVRSLNQKKYNISKHRFMELYHYCLQYREWQEELTGLDSTVKGVDTSGDGISGNGAGDPTARMAIRRQELSDKCELIEETAREADPEIYHYLLKTVTIEDMTYSRLALQGLPCGRDRYYNSRRKFYWLLDKKL